MQQHRKWLENYLKEVEEADRKFEQEYFEQMKQVFDEKPHLAYAFAEMEDLKTLYPRVHAEAITTIEYLEFQQYQRKQRQQIIEEQIIKDLNN